MAFHQNTVAKYHYNTVGSKELGTNVLELQCVMLVNYDQNI